jgi:hypothetical protein
VADSFIDRVVTARFHDAVLELNADDRLHIAKQVDDAERVEMHGGRVMPCRRGRKRDAMKGRYGLERIQKVRTKLRLNPRQT